MSVSIPLNFPAVSQGKGPTCEWEPLRFEPVVRVEGRHLIRCDYLSSLRHELVHLKQ